MDSKFKSNTILKLIDIKKYPEILGIILGIEFDTKLDEDANNYGHTLLKRMKKIVSVLLEAIDFL
jgi:hypothetical protein